MLQYEHSLPHFTARPTSPPTPGTSGLPYVQRDTSGDSCSRRAAELYTGRRSISVFPVMSEEQDAPTARGIVLSLQNTLLESAVKGGGAAWVSHASLMMQVREGGGGVGVACQPDDAVGQLQQQQQQHSHNNNGILVIPASLCQPLPPGPYTFYPLTCLLCPLNCPPACCAPAPPSSSS